MSAMKDDTAHSGIHVDATTLIALRPNARGITVRARRQRRNMVAGGKRSVLKARGMDYAESRVYQPGDNVRNIDWRVTARSGVAHTKLYEEEKQRAVMIAVDYGASMRFGTRRALKSVAAAEAASLLSWAAVANKDRVGGLVFGLGDDYESRPDRSSHGALHFIQQLVDAHIEPTEAAGTDALAKTLKRLQFVARPGSVVSVISDFQHISADSERYLGLLAQHVELVLIWVHDPLEKQLPPAGRYHFADWKGRRTTSVDTAVSKTREEHARRFEAKREQLENLSLRRGAMLVELSTQDDASRVLLQALGARR